MVHPMIEIKGIKKERKIRIPYWRVIWKFLGDMQEQVLGTGTMVIM